MRDSALVIFGATGDLAQRMLWPSLYYLEADQLLPDAFSIIGSARTPMEDDAFRAYVRACVARRGAVDEAVWARLAPRLRYCGGSVDDKATFQTLGALCGETQDRVFYLSTSPALYGVIVNHLSASGLAAPPARIIVEKPLGRDFASCDAINDALGVAFSEHRIFRIDHYLGKETVQNLIALRFANTLFEPLWNNVSIDHVQISVSETVGVEGRGAYYNEYGALRDMVQSHLLQLLCLVAMEPPSSLEPDAVRNEKVKVLRSLRPIAPRDVAKLAIRGQYKRGYVDGVQSEDYTAEAGVAASETETFVAVCANIDNWRWAGVPFYLRTGKRMPERSSQIVIQFRNVPHSIFGASNLEANRLTIRLQPEEEISLALMNKRASLRDSGFGLQPVALNLSIDDTENGRRRIAYERLLLEAMNANSTLFVRRDEAEAAWRWIDGIEEGWAQQKTPPLPYNAGAWGPSASFGLVERDGRSWCE